MKVPAPRFLQIVERLLDRQGHFRTGEVAAAAGVSRQAAHRRLAAMARKGVLMREGAGRGARYLRGSMSCARFSYRRAGLEEDRVWAEARSKVPFLGALSGNVERILRYALTEMVNNAIDHSRSPGIEVLFSPPAPSLSFEVLDRGVGIFDHLRRRLKLPNRMAALAELSKGKTTTEPEKHTGEGIFFVSKIADCFQLESADLRWIVDNVRSDTAVASVSPPRKGTRVRFEISPGKKRSLKSLFDEYTEDYRFTRTRVVVRLFAHGVRFVSRSEAKRLLSGLDRFTEVVLDFDRVEEVGQGFADEVFRVWTRAHGGTRLRPVHMTPAVEFMVRRAAKTRLDFALFRGITSAPVKRLQPGRPAQRKVERRRTPGHP